MLVLLLSNMTGLVELFLFGALLYWLFGTSGRRFPMADVLGTLQHVYANWERKCISSFNARGAADTLVDTSPAAAAGQANAADSRPPSQGLRTFGYAKRTLNNMYHKEQNVQVRDRQLFRAKSAPMVGVKYKIPRHPIALCCLTCAPSSRESILVEKQIPGLEVHNVLVVKEEGGIMRRFFKHLIHNWALPRFHYPQIYKSVLEDERVKLAIERAAKYEAQEMMSPDRESSNLGSSGNASDSNHEEVDAVHISDKVLSVLIEKHQKRAKEILQIMRSKLSDLLLRITSWVLYKVLPIFLTSVIVRKEQVAMLRQAGRSGLPLIFLPLHRSHLDYILMSFILLNNKVKAPLVAAGDNLKIPVFGWLLRGLGAFYIKRKIDPNTGRKDLVYRAVLHTYMVENLKAGHNVEFFIEGGRTRTGKACMPKGGLLSVIIDSYIDGVIEDALLVPVSINYERLVDGNFIREQLGQPKIMESFTSASKAIWQTINSNYGMMRVDFSQPFCLSELVKSYQKSVASRCGSLAPESLDNGLKLTRTLSLGSGTVNHTDGSVPRILPKIILPNNSSILHRPPSSVSLYGTDVVVEEQRNVVENIARHIVYDCTQAMAIMTTNAVGFLLLNKFRNGTTLEELVIAMDQLRLDVRVANRYFGFDGDSVDVINHALSVFGPNLVTRERITTTKGDTIFIKPVTEVPFVIELSYYANTVMSLYCLEAVVATAICSFMPGGTLRATGGPTISQDVLLSRCLDVCNVMQLEFIFTKPCQSLEQALVNTIDNFHMRTYIKLKGEVEDVETEAVYALQSFKYLDLEDLNEDEYGYVEGEERDYIPTPLLYTVTEDPEYLDRLRYYVRTLRPLMEAYAASGACLARLVGREITERDLVLEVMAETELQLKNGLAHYDESRSMDPIRNSLRLLEKWDVLECSSHDKIKVYYLQAEYDDVNAVQPIAEMLQSLVCSVE